MSLAKIVVCIVVVVAITVAVIYLCGQFEQTRFIYDGANNLVSKVTKTATDNPAITATLSTGVVAAGAGVIKDKFNSVKDSASQKVADTQTAANSAIESVKVEKTAALTQVENVTGQLKAKESEIGDLKAKYSDVDDLIKDQESQILAYKSQISDLQGQLARSNAVVNDPRVQEVLKPPIP